MATILSLISAALALNVLAPPQKMVGMYVHQHWPYRHPYCARTWTLHDWSGYAEGLQKLGYNTILIWPMLEIMPDPLTPSDEASIQKIRRVIDMLHRRGMRAYIVLCPNMVGDNQEASKATFETRHYFLTEKLVDPRDPEAMRRMLAWRKKLLAPLKRVDGIAMIDSDPGGYPGTSIEDFVNVVGAHRTLLDELRPGPDRIELIYWMHAGWRGWSRLYELAKFELGRPEEYQETVDRLVKLNPEPWGMANGLEYARKRGVDERVISFNYGRIELEPSFPMTNFTPERAYEGGSLPGPRGVMGNAQTHCAQLPNTFAFVRGAQGRPVTAADFVQFANDLIPGQGEAIVRGWKALAGADSASMRASEAELAAVQKQRLTGGPLKGLLFGSPHRFVNDLVMMLRLKAAGEEFARAHEAKAEIKPSFRRYVEAYEAWQKTHGFEGAQDLGRPAAAIRAIRHPAIQEVFAKFRYDLDPMPGRPNTNFERIRAGFAHMESFSVRIGKAMRAALESMP